MEGNKIFMLCTYFINDVQWIHFKN